jgi:hypothetical protein
MPDAGSERSRPITRYTRDRGAVAWELPLLGPQGRSPEALVAQLLRCGLAWVWTRERPPAAPEEPPEACTRLTRLTADTAAALVGELEERDPDGYGRFVALVGRRPASPGLEAEEDLRRELAAFARDREGAVELVVVQLGDTPDDQVYARRHPSEPAARLLRAWGIPAADARERPYGALGVATLERMFGLPALPAGPELQPPVLRIARNGFLDAVRRPEELEVCGSYALRSGYFEGLRLVDATGRSWRVRCVAKVGSVGPFWGFRLRGPRRVRIRMDREEESRFGLEDLKDRVCRAIEQLPEPWEAVEDIEETKARARRATDIPALIELFVGHA